MKKYTLAKGYYPQPSKKEYAENFDDVFFDRVLQAEIPPRDWLTSRKIISWGSWVTWVTNGAGDYCPVHTEKLIPYSGDLPVGSSIAERPEDAA